MILARTGQQLKQITKLKRILKVNGQQLLLLVLLLPFPRLSLLQLT